MCVNKVDTQPTLYQQGPKAEKKKKTKPENIYGAFFNALPVNTFFLSSSLK